MPQLSAFDNFSTSNLFNVYLKSSTQPFRNRLTSKAKLSCGEILLGKFLVILGTLSDVDNYLVNTPCSGEEQARNICNIRFPKLQY